MTNKLALLTALLAVTASPSAAQSPEESAVRAAVERYNTALTTKDLASLKALLAEDMILYEHSVRNIGLADVWENHLRPEVEAFQDTKAEFTDLRVWVSGGVALVTRQYAIKATMNGRPIDARGNETMGWALRDGAWKVVHIHYSHPCPRPSGG
ncbi:MAG TPA: nuclear transport factor 2 family protein [Gemmatimonadales bacterium]